MQFSLIISNTLTDETHVPAGQSRNGAAGSLPDSRHPWKSSVKRKREFFGRAHESARSDDRDSFLRTSPLLRVVSASNAGPDIHLLSRAAESRRR